MDDPARAVPVEQGAHGVPIRDVDLLEREGGKALEPREPGLLEPDVVVLAQVVDTGYGITARGEREADLRADEPRGPGDEDRH